MDDIIEVVLHHFLLFHESSFLVMRLTLDSNHAMVMSCVELVAIGSRFLSRKLG